MMDVKRKIFFNEERHEYTDEFGNKYTSMTTLIGKHEKKFDAKAMARICFKAGLNGNPKYKGKTEKQILAEWLQSGKDACAKGNSKHNYLEDGINDITGFNVFKRNLVGGKLYTVDDILEDDSLGRVDLDVLYNSGIKERYPKIYNVINEAHKLGYKVYAEIGVYDSSRLISGCIDLFFVNDKNEFIVGDWKTNKFKVLKEESGYFIKDSNGNLTDNYKYTNEYFKAPLSHIQCGLLNKYKLQLNGYARLAELHGLTYKSCILFHITDDLDENNKEIVNTYPISDLRNDVEAMFESHGKHINKNLTLFRI